ncbi:MAG: methyltransferase domain-containing protein [Candidatus Obscuribacterales bacterium]
MSKQMRCNNCSSRKGAEVGPANLRLFRCQTCDLIYSLEPVDYLCDPDRDSIFNKPGRDLSQALSYCKGPDLRILQLDCDEGLWLSAFARVQTHTLQTCGTENRSDRADAAFSLGHEIFRQSPDDLDLPRESFDFIFAIHTLEQCLDPGDLADRVYDSLKPAGIFLIRALDSDRIPLDRLPLPVNYLFNRESLDYLALKIGFEPIETGRKTILPRAGEISGDILDVLMHRPDC